MSEALRKVRERYARQIASASNPERRSRGFDDVLHDIEAKMEDTVSISESACCCKKKRKFEFLDEMAILILDVQNEFDGTVLELLEGAIISKLQWIKECKVCLRSEKKHAKSSWRIRIPLLSEEEVLGFLSINPATEPDQNEFKEVELVAKMLASRLQVSFFVHKRELEKLYQERDASNEKASQIEIKTIEIGEDLAVARAQCAHLSKLVQAGIELCAIPEEKDLEQVFRSCLKKNFGVGHADIFLFDEDTNHTKELFDGAIQNRNSPEHSAASKQVVLARAVDGQWHMKALDCFLAFLPFHECMVLEVAESTGGNYFTESQLQELQEFATKFVPNFVSRFASVKTKADLQFQVQALEKDMNSLKVGWPKLQGELCSLRAENNVLKKENSCLKIEIEKLSTNRNQLEHDVQKLMEEGAILQSNNSMLANEVNFQKQQVESALIQKQKANLEIEGKRKEFDALLGEQSALQIKFQSLRSCIKDEQRKQAASVAETCKMSHELSLCNAEIVDLREKLDEKELGKKQVERIDKFTSCNLPSEDDSLLKEKDELIAKLRNDLLLLEIEKLRTRRTKCVTKKKKKHSDKKRAGFAVPTQSAKTKWR